jgi:hypothetical protein
MKTKSFLLALVTLAAAMAIPVMACPRLPHDWQVFPKADRVHVIGIEYLEPDPAQRLIDPGTTTITPDNVMHIRGRKTRGWLELSVPELGIGNLKLSLVFEGNSDWNLADMTSAMWGVATCYLDGAPVANCLFFGERENLGDASGPRWRATFEWIGRFSDSPLEGTLLFAHETIETNLPTPETYIGHVDGVLLIPKTVDLKPHKPCRNKSGRG